MATALISQTRNQIDSHTTVHYHYPKGSTSHHNTVSNHEPDTSRLPVTIEPQINVKTINHYAQSDTKHSELTSVPT
jgi:hypothetical protein